jgi:hypothetical protein
MDIVLIGQASRIDYDEKNLCGFVASAIDTGMGGHYDHVVLPVADLTGAPINGQSIGAIARCRLAVAVVEDHADQVVKHLTLVVHPDQVASLCRGIDIAGPLCFTCDHPCAGVLKTLPR